MSDLSLLLDMGFPQDKAEKALNVTGNKGVEPAMEWLLAHSDADEPMPENTFPNIEERSTNSVGVHTENTFADGEMSSASIEIPTETPQEGENVTEKLGDDELLCAKSIKCDECGKKFREDSEVEFHAVKTGHSSFSESADEFKPLSEEEKKEQIKKIETLIKQRRSEKAENDKKQALEKEKNRRKTGQELTHVRQKMQEQEMKQLAELKRREKMEDKLARQRVLEDIERDKQARRLKFNMPGSSPPATVSTEKEITPVTPVAQSPTEAFDECRIQVRLTNGQCLTQTFSPNEELAAVRLFVQMHRSDDAGPFALMTNFPKKVFTEDDMNAPLSTLGLVPSAVLIVCKPH